MTENEDREALAKLVHETIYAPGSSWERAGENTRQYIRERTDVLLAAGFRRPRTVSTVEELDALPVSSVVLEPLFDAVMQKGSAQTWWGVARDRQFHLPPSLPAVVLWEPTE